jgi:hypothetical protein
MEEELLQEMIRDRETALVQIQKKMVEQANKMERYKSQLKEVRMQQELNTVEQQQELETLVGRKHQLLMQYKEAKEGLDMKKQQQQQGQGANLHIYNEVMKLVATPESRDSSYVMRMQAQLCKAMHSMGMVETQLALATNQSEALQKYMKDKLTGTVEEKSQVELHLMNDLVVTDNARREVETKHKQMLIDFVGEKDAILERIDKEKEEPPEEDDDEEKAELTEILTQGTEEIERMVAENKGELEKLEELKIKVAEMKGEGFVEDIVSSISEEFKERENEDEEEGSDDE